MHSPQRRASLALEAWGSAKEVLGPAPGPYMSFSPTPAHQEREESSRGLQERDRTDRQTQAGQELPSLHCWVWEASLS